MGQPGDRQLLFTDGLTETRDAEGRFFGVEGIEAVLTSLADDAESGQALDAIFVARRRFTHDASQGDDALALATRFF